MTIITDEQIAYIESGGVIAYPTSTLPGLGCLPTKEGLDRLFELKSRSSDNPVSIVVASLEQVAHLVHIDAQIVEFVEAFPRGGLSVLYPAQQPLDARLGGQFVAVRVFEHPAARALAQAVGPVTATSANEAGEEPANTVAEAIFNLHHTRHTYPVVAFAMGTYGSTPAKCGTSKRPLMIHIIHIFNRVTVRLVAPSYNS